MKLEESICATATFRWNWYQFSVNTVAGINKVSQELTLEDGNKEKYHLNFMIVCLHSPKVCKVKLSPDTWSLLNNKDEDYSLTKSSLCKDNGFICYKVKNSVSQDKHIIQNKWTLWYLNNMWNFKMTSIIWKMFNNGSWVNNGSNTNNRGRLFYHFRIIQPSPKYSEITVELFWIIYFHRFYILIQ